MFGPSTLSLVINKHFFYGFSRSSLMTQWYRDVRCLSFHLGQKRDKWLRPNKNFFGLECEEKAGKRRACQRIRARSRHSNLRTLSILQSERKEKRNPVFFSPIHMDDIFSDETVPTLDLGHHYAQLA
ncbi:hypothetical protein CEXT_404741 [Caerostris extrusa]|uniref:Uncharacterized protein n=1 Tax=Caerostris extrusa TaxID=172846 RepID=A0AAV4Y154_CAEEX|nr:hypothetical protein CEXT_404741 [Caerostris extrusa]